MSLGLTSESNVIYRNRDMLLKRNLKTKNPCLCLYMEVLLRLLDLRFDLAYFNSFCASFLCVIN